MISGLALFGGLSEYEMLYDNRFVDSCEIC